MKTLKKSLFSILLCVLCIICIFGITACKNEPSSDSTPTQSETSTGGDLSSSESDSDSSEGENLSSNESDNSVSEENNDSSQEDSSHTHSYTISVTNPTCTEQGFTTHSCSCGDCYIDTYTDALPHLFINYVSDNNATYEKDGTKTATCERDGCNEKDTITDVGSMLVRNGLTFKTLSVNGTNVYGKVNNTTETFSFINEITVSGKTKFIVSMDIYGVQQVATKTIALEIGDNTVYVTEMVDDEPINVYTVTVRRRPTYDVTFNANGGTTVEKQTIEEDGFASEPITTKTGYTFKAWNYDFTKPITNDTEITASWTANTNTPYKVEYYLQNLENDEYTLETTENKTGTTDTTANAEIKTFTHFTHIASETDSGNIAPNGSTILKVYYTRDGYTVTFNGNGGALVSGIDTQIVKYQGSATAPSYQRVGYDFEEFDKAFTNISGDLLVTAQWNTIFLLSESGNEILGLTEYGANNYSDVIIPENVDGKEINAIGERAFWAAEINSIAIPQSVTSVGSHAFAHSSLTAITLPSSIITFAEGAFRDCNNIKTVYYSGTLENWLTSTWQYAYIESSPFYYGADLYIKGEKLTVLDSTNIPKNITTINAMAFYGCSSLERVDIPSNITKIEDSAFSDCKNLTYLSIPSSVTELQPSFCNCVSLQEINFDAVVASSKYNAYFLRAGKNSDGIVLKIGKHVKEIGKSAFNNANIKQVIFDEESICERIEDFAFKGCTNLKNILIPDSVRDLYTRSFEGSGLENITIGSGVAYINSYTFLNCVKLKDIIVSPNNENYQSIDGCLYSKNSSGIRLIKYPPAKESTVFSVSHKINLTLIDSDAFLDASKLSTIVIPETLTSIFSHDIEHRMPFARCSSLVSFIVEENNTQYSSIDGNLYTKDGETLVAYAPGKTAEEFEIPDEVSCIGKYAFAGCNNLKKVIIPNTVTLINSYAFYDCDNLTNILFCEDSQLIRIASYAILNCDNLSEINIPDSVMYIGESCFNACNNLTSVVIGDSILSIGNGAFSYCSRLTSVVIGDNIMSIEDAVFAGCSSLTSVYYKGTASEWMNISIGNSNEKLTSATIYYYIENEKDVPTDGGNYWHYDENGNVAIWKI